VSRVYRTQSAAERDAQCAVPLKDADLIELNIPGRGDYRLAHLTLDLNGTVGLDGRLVDGVAERLRILGDRLDVHVLTADTLGLMGEIEGKLGFPATRARTGADKMAVVERLGGASVVAVGNGTIDAGMLSAAALGIAVLGCEGLACEALEAADVVTPDILTALDLLLNPARLIATLRR
jgi:soluble P-type ATPase